MKIKLAILESDAHYLERIMSVFTNNFSDKVEVHGFTSLETTMQNLAKLRVNVLLSADSFDVDASLLPKHCAFAWFVESGDIEDFKGHRAISKFQKVELIYKAVLELFSESVPDDVGLRFEGDSSARIFTFVSASGGAGSSCAAIACAKALATVGKRVLYLNLECFGEADLFFTGQGSLTLHDVIFVLKSKKSNLSIKLESCVRQDASGVFFFAAPKSALDITELTEEEIRRLIMDLKITGSYDEIVFDIDFSLDNKTFAVLSKSSAIVFVSDGSEIANAKFIRAYKAIEIQEQQLDSPLLPRVCVFYNKFGSQTGRKLEDGIRELGGAPRYQNATAQQVVSQLVSLGVFQKL